MIKNSALKKNRQHNMQELRKQIKITKQINMTVK